MKSGCVLVKSVRCIGSGSGRIQTGRELVEVSVFRRKPQLNKRKTHKATLHRVRIPLKGKIKKRACLIGGKTKMTTLEKMDELCDEMDNDTSISEIFALLEAIYRMTNEKEMGIPETTLLYMARDWAKWAQDNFNAYTLSLSRIIKEAKDEAGANREERTK